MTFAIGSLVKARGREWVVLPESNAELLIVRPLGGTDDEVTGILTSLESVASAQFMLPNPEDIGDYRSCRLLRDAVRISSRASCGPFRSFARIAVDPRPYQLVPLLMALKLDPVRLLIADDVGIGKTIEALLIAREMFDRGEVQRIAVLCPPHLADQWQKELLGKFHIEAELVLPNTAARLERACRPGQSLFDIYPHVVVSMDFIKSERRRDDFARACPEMVIIDEAHTCAYGYEGKGRHQRHQLITRLAERADRHMIFVTATPHSGKEESFRSLLQFLNPEFANLPEELAGAKNETFRRSVASQFVQRRRADIRHFLQTDTPFPTREEREETYALTPEYRKLFNRVLEYTKESVIDTQGGQRIQRVRWWSALALLRALSSSPAAAAASLRNRAPAAEAETVDEVDEIGKHSVFDLQLEDQIEGVDLTPGSDIDTEPESESKIRRRLLEMAREADKLRGDADQKLMKAVALVKDLVAKGFSPIVFCRFIDTAEYVTKELRERLPRGIEVSAVTGLLPHADREGRILSLAGHNKKVLVCTDCLSEGINLQEHFNAVLHYDLSWNPTRHEQREGRVDRYGQPKATVRVITYYGSPIDGIVIDVLIKKHGKIRSALGISVPVPADTDSVMNAIFEGLLLRNRGEKSAQLMLDGFEEYMRPNKEDLHNRWDEVSNREKRSRTMFAQESIRPEEVSRELQESRSSIGSAGDVAWFSLEALKANRAVVTEKESGFEIDLRESPRSLRDQLKSDDTFDARFELPVEEEVRYLHRTHPFVESLAGYVMDTTLDPLLSSVAHRVGVIRTRDVTRRTTLLLLRFRYDLRTKQKNKTSSQIAEECFTVGFTGSMSSPEWLSTAAAQELLNAQPHGNVLPEQARDLLNRVVEEFESLQKYIEKAAHDRAAALLEAHQRVRQASRIIGLKYEISPQLPADVLGIYIYLPAV